MKFNSFILIVFLSGCTIKGEVQSLRVDDIIYKMIKAVERYDNRQYNAQMLFKDFSSDTFEVSDFTVQHRKNPENTIYGYDWKITEHLKTKFNYTHMVIGDTLYVIYDGNKGIGVNKLKDVIDPGTHMEAIRHYFILEQNIAPFESTPFENVTLVDSNNYYYLTTSIREIDQRELVLNKTTYLPIKSTSTIKSSDFDFTQIMEVYFNYNLISNNPDSSFSILYYLAQGYNPTYNHKDKIEYKEPFLFNSDSRDLLFNFPFVDHKGDTVYIRNLKEKYILIDFWYASCFPCLKSMPKVNALAEKYAHTNLKVIGINCIDGGNFDFLSSKLRDKGIDFPLYYGSRAITESLIINAFPTYLLISPDGNVKHSEGNISKIEKELRRVFGY